jgi:hypothetical protein
VAALPLWALGIPAGTTVLYLGLCRVLVRGERRSWRRTVASAAGTSAAGTFDAGRTAQATATVGTVAVSEPEPAPAVEARNAQGFAEVSAQEDTVTLRTEDLQAASLWDPLPITLPTYVSKPKARRTVRTIDLNAQDVSSSGRDAADSQLVAETSSADDQPAEPRRAVGS